MFTIVLLCYASVYLVVGYLTVSNSSKIEQTHSIKDKYLPFSPARQANITILHKGIQVIDKLNIDRQTGYLKTNADLSPYITYIYLRELR